MSDRPYVPGPSYKQMCDGVKTAPNELFRIGWYGPALELPREITGVDARIVVLTGYNFPSGSHKVGATYSIVMEAEKRGEIAPGRTRLIGPSTGNFGIGTAWTSWRKGYDAVVVMPDGMSPERTQRIRQYGSDIVFTPGTESDVLLTIEKAKEMGAESDNFVLAQFEDMANYRFHYHVTGNAALQRVYGRIGAFVSAPGSAGTFAAADRIKAEHPDCLGVAAEPVQCPTLFNGGAGHHCIEGIGDKMAPLVLNLLSVDRIALVDDRACVDVLYDLVTGWRYRYEFGISGVCNILAAIQTAKAEGFGPDVSVVTVATDGLDRYHSYIQDYKDPGGDPCARHAARVEAMAPSAANYKDSSGLAERQRLHELKDSLWSRWYPDSLLASMKDAAWWRGEAERTAEIDAA